MKINPLINNIKPYTVDPIKVDIVLNANETKQYLFDEITLEQINVSKYPDTNAFELRKKLSEKVGVDPSMITIGNGSTQLLELTVRAFSEPNDTIVSFSPSFSMYDIYAKNQGASLKKVSILEDGTMPVDTMIKTIKDSSPSIVFICNPNNPTGSMLTKQAVLSIIESTDALVVVDEAYMEFALEQESIIGDIKKYDNVLVARTFSKAYGLAGLRLGYMIGSESLINVINALKLPYAVNAYSQVMGIKALNKETKVQQFLKSIIQSRETLYNQLNQFDLKVYPSFANFLYVKSDVNLKDRLLSRGILIRAFKEGYYRITIGNEIENKALIKALEEVLI